MRRAAEATYVLVVAAVATYGFVSGSAGAVVAAILLALPTSVVMIVGYYLAYGLLAQLPGASTPSGDQAPWLAATAAVLGVLAMVAAALVHVVLLRLLPRLVAHRRGQLPVDDDSRPDVRAC